MKSTSAEMSFWTIKRKILASFACIILIVSLSSIIALVQLYNLKSSSTHSAEQQKQWSEAGAIFVNIDDQVGFIRTFLLTGDLEAVAHYNKSREKYSGAMHNLLASENLSPVLKQRLETIRDLSLIWQKNVAARQIIAMQNPLTVDEARAMEVRGDGEIFLSNVHGLRDEISAELQNDLNASMMNEDSAFSMALWSIIVGLLVSSGLALGLVVLLNNNITSPLSRFQEVMTALAGGQRDLEVPEQDRRDELGQMAGALGHFCSVMQEAERLSREQMLAEKQRAEQAEHLVRTVRAFESDISGSLTQVRDASEGMRSRARNLSDIASGTNDRAIAVATATEQAAASVQTVASAAEELGASISEIASQVVMQSEIARHASETATMTNDRINELAESARRIGEVVDLITGIAEQTNLLALNATIEAARAGDAGKGFAVVATEVKALATQTGNATEEIAGQIRSIQESTGNTVTLMRDIGDQIHQMNEIAAAVASAVEEQTAATREISVNAQHAATGTHDVSNNIGAVSNAAGETGTVSTEVLAASEQLLDETRGMSQRIEDFLVSIRAA